METTGISWPIIIATIAGGALSALWVFQDGRGRDYNPVLWAVGCIFSALTVGLYGVLAVLVAYFILRPRGELLICPHCSKKYIYNLAFCPHCRKPVKKECLKCHDLMELDAETCPHCRTRTA